MEENLKQEPQSLDILSGIEHPAEPSTFLQEDKWWDVDITPNMLDVRRDIARPEYTLSYNGVPFAPLGAIHALTGQKKNGKTMTETLLIAAILRGECGGLKYELEGTPSVLYIDTEMEQDNSLMVARRVHHMMGWDYQTPNDRFRILWLRNEEKTETRWKKTIKAIDTYRPTVVLLDGIRDVIGDFNDLEASSELVRKCMNIVTEYHCSMWCILHENPGSDKMRGHLGTELGNKISDTFVTTKTKNQKGVYFTVKQVDARGKDVEDFKFEVRDDKVRFGIPTLLDGQTAARVEADNLGEIDAAMKAAIGTSGSMKYGELKEKLKTTLNIGSTKAENHIKTAIAAGVIGCVNNRYTYRGIVTKTDENEAPF